MSTRATALAISAALAVGMAASAFADDGELLRKSMSSSSGTTEVPIPEAEHAFIDYMKFYVPAQSSDGTLVDIEYSTVDDGDGEPTETRDQAKPLVGVYIYGPVVGVDGVGFVGHGARDAFAAVSLDDGNTWKRTNLSDSAGKSSITVTDPFPDPTDPANADRTDYPGDVINIFHAVAGNRVIVAWPSRYCQTGSPGYTADAETVGGYLGIDNTEDLYLTDLFGVAGSQSSVDYSGDEFEQNQPVGEVPFSCLWTARGVLVNGDDPNTEATESSYMVWFKPERLTSGRRDVNRVEIRMVEGAGAVVTWQEDPEGLRPGQGEGPGEGWSGAIANNQTDVWYSFLPWEEFDTVDADGSATPLADYLAGGATEKPGHYVPFAVPMRLTNNAKCNVLEEGQDPATADDGYCYGDIAGAYGLQDNCADAATIPQGQNREGDICIAESGLPNIGNTAATRPRLSLQPRDTDDDGVTDSAWVVVIAEEDKGFGRYAFLVGEENAETATPCDDETAEDCEVADRGKNIWYYSFDMGDPQTSLAADGTTPAQDDPTSLVANLVNQGNMLNQAETDWRTGAFYPPMDTADMWNFVGNNEGGADYDFLLYRTEIARRGSLLVQSTEKAALGQSGLAALPSWKQGLLNQGGPADVMVRRIVFDFNGGGGDECPIVVEADQPVITSASWNAQNRRLLITGSGADGLANTKVLIRNAVSQDLVGDGVDRTNPADLGTFDFGISINTNKDPVPCAVQAADDDGTPAYGPYIAVENAPADCAASIPEECPTDGGALVAAADVVTGSENPYDFANMVCGAWTVEPDSNPYYPKGLCADPAINLSGTTPETCEASGDLSDGTCPTIAEDGTTLDDPADQQIFDKMTTWFQCPGSDLCETDAAGTALGLNLDDQSWHNPLEVAKGHRGFLDGDFAMILYAWSPNWKLNAVGRDRYELYIRRSFDGGVTWTTLPASYIGTDDVTAMGMGTTTCETMRDGATSADDSQRCLFYESGSDEQARNVSQLKSQAFTILDPRYTPTAASILDDTTGLPTYEPTDLRVASRYFIVYETGDNTTTIDGEPEPLDLFYGRAVRYGDDYQVWSEEDTLLTTCLPDGSTEFPVLDTDFCNEFDDLEGRRETESGEASVVASPAGDFLYSVWSQAELDGDTGELIRTDAMFRRVWYLDDFIPADAPINTTP